MITQNTHASWLSATALSMLALVASSGASEAQLSTARAKVETIPSGVEQILPRGQIAAVFEPTFVSAEEAEISDDAWVLGVEFEGTARAYSLNLLNRHEVVNDRIGDRAFAAVW